MKLNDIQPAIASFNANPIVRDLRGHTYLSTYPSILAVAGAGNVNNVQHFHQLAVLVYGWMPRVIRIDQAFSNQAIAAFVAARQATVATYQNVAIQDIANCLHSLVGASKLLHFVNPVVFPIWDSKIQTFRNIPNSNMKSLQHYLDYVNDVHAIINDHQFPAFINNFNAAYNNRLNQSNIRVYQVGSVRAVEAAAFELAP